MKELLAPLEVCSSQYIYQSELETTLTSQQAKVHDEVSNGRKIRV